MKRLCIFFLLVIAFAKGQAQTTSISGQVKTTKGLPVANANISLKDTYDGSSTDSIGTFRFTTTEKGRQVLVFSGLNYDTDSLVLTLSGQPVQLTLSLRETSNLLNTVTISAGSIVAGDSKKGAVLTAVEIATTAGARADIFAAMQTLPGTQTSFSESGLFVRGGAAAETKTYFDGMLVKSPFNATIPNQASRGRLSAFLFKGTSFSAGGYSAEYGQALSSALLLESTDLPEKTTTGISLLSVGGGLDQTIRFSNSALSVGGYYYNLAPSFRLIKQAQEFVKAPEQVGGTLQYKAKISETGMFKLYASYGHSRLSLNQQNINTPGKTDYFDNRNGDAYLNSTYKAYWGSSWKMEAGLALNDDRNSGETGGKNYTRNDHLFEAKTTITHYYGRMSSVKTGVESFRTGRSESLNNLGRDYDDQISAAFAETDLFLSRNVVIRAGLRTEYSSYLHEHNLAPRTSLGVKTGKNSQVSLAYGRFYQNPEDDYLVQKPLDFEQADHYILKYERNTAQRNFRVEAYHKEYAQLTKLAAGTPFNGGSGYARGVDVFWRDKKSIRNGDYRVSYSYLDTKRNMLDFPGQATPGFAAKHTANLVYSQFFESIQSQVQAAYTFATGRTYVNPNNPVYRSDLTPNYQNLSVTVSYLTHILKQFTVVYLNTNNIPGFKNVYGYQYSTDGTRRQPIVPGARRDVFIGLLMTIGDDTFVR